MKHKLRRTRIAMLLSAASAVILACSPAPSGSATGANSGANAAANSGANSSANAGNGKYAALDKLPDIGGYWGAAGGGLGPPNADKPALRPEAAAEVARRQELSKQGKPFGTNSKCLPRGGTSWWTAVPAKEIEVLPGKIYMWGVLDQDSGMNIRRIYTDGRQHSADPDPTFMGEAIGTWQGDTLVVDTIGFLPSVAAASEIANGGDMHMVERFHLTDPNTLKIDIEVDAPNVLTEPYKFSRTLIRRTGESAETHELACLQNGVDKVDENGLQYLETTPPADVLEAVKNLQTKGK